jgi:hypothetical protein
VYTPPYTCAPLTWRARVGWGVHRSWLCAGAGGSAGAGARVWLGAWGTRGGVCGGAREVPGCRVCVNETAWDVGLGCLGWFGTVPYHTTQLSITRPSVRLSTHAVRHYSTAHHSTSQSSHACFNIAALRCATSAAAPGCILTFFRQPAQSASEPASQPGRSVPYWGASSSFPSFAFSPAPPCFAGVSKLRMTDGLPAYLPTYPIGMPRQLSSAQLSCFSRGAAARVHVCFLYRRRAELSTA